MRIITYNKYIITRSGSDNDGLSAALRDLYRIDVSRARFKPAECNLYLCNSLLMGEKPLQMKWHALLVKWKNTGSKKGWKVVQKQPHDWVEWGRVNLESIAREPLEIRGLFSVYLFSPFSCFHLLLVWGIWAHLMLWTFYMTKIKFVHLSTTGVIADLAWGQYLIWWTGGFMLLTHVYESDGEFWTLWCMMASSCENPLSLHEMFGI